MTENFEEIKIQKQPLLKFAKIFALVWILFIAIPTIYIANNKSFSIQQYGIVLGVRQINSFLEDQYNSLATKALNKINIDKYTSKISIPTIDFEKELKLDSISEISNKTAVAKKATSAISKLGIKNISKLDTNLETIQKQIDDANKKLKDSANKLNQQISTTTNKLKTNLSSDLKSGLKDELSSLTGNQIRSQLNLTNQQFTVLKKGTFEIDSKDTADIYNSLKASGIFKQFIKNTEKYASVIKTILLITLSVFLFIPPILVWVVAKVLSKKYTTCPYCNKVFISKKFL